MTGTGMPRTRLCCPIFRTLAIIKKNSSTISGKATISSWSLTKTTQKVGPSERQTARMGGRGGQLLLAPARICTHSGPNASLLTAPFSPLVLHTEDAVDSAVENKILLQVNDGAKSLWPQAMFCAVVVGRRQALVSSCEPILLAFAAQC